MNLFSYRKGTSLLHRSPAIIKLATLFILCIFTFKDGTLASAEQILSFRIIARTVICLIFAVFLFFISGADLNSVIQLKFVLVLGAFVTFMRMIHIPFWFDKDGLVYGLMYTVRFFITSLAAQVIFETTSSLEIKEAVELCQNGITKVFPPLKKWNPALVISLAINFIPDVFDTWNRVSVAARARSRSCGKRKFSITILTQEFSALFSCLFHHAEIKRKAVLNRSLNS